MKDCYNLKNTLRKEKIAARNMLTASERAELSEIVSNKIIESKIFQNAQNIMLYRAVKGEVSLRLVEEVAKKSGKRVAFPLCISNEEMIALEPTHHLAWMKGSFGIEEPVLEESNIILPENIDLIISPCTVFDEAGGRIGMGAGYYDRYLEKCANACICAAAFEVQKTKHVLMEAWDKRMQYIFTEERIYCGTIRA